MASDKTEMRKKKDVPQQTVAVINHDGLECLYDVKLEKPTKIVI